jgi:hypothetical protein
MNFATLLQPPPRHLREGGRCGAAPCQLGAGTLIHAVCISPELTPSTLYQRHPKAVGPLMAALSPPPTAATRATLHYNFARALARFWMGSA